MRRSILSILLRSTYYVRDLRTMRKTVMSLFITLTIEVLILEMNTGDYAGELYLSLSIKLEHDLRLFVVRCT